MIDNPKTESAKDQDDNWDDWDEDDGESKSFSRMGFLDHLGELRSRLFKIVLGVLLGIVVTWNFVDPIWSLMEEPARQMLRHSQEKSFAITRAAENINITLPRFRQLPSSLQANPELKDYLNSWVLEANEELQTELRNLLVARDSKLMQTSITEAFFLKVKLSFMAGIVLMFPFIMYQVWAFVAPGLYKKEKYMAFPFIVFSTLFFIGGMMFGYYIAVPFAGRFLMSFGGDFVQMITIDKYMDFLMTMMLGLGIVFEIPMVIFLLSKLGIATPRWLLKNFRYAVLIIIIVAAVITPTGDPVNLAIFSAPMIILYLLGIGIAAIWGPKKKDDDDDDDDDDPEPWEEEYEEIEDSEPADPAVAEKTSTTSGKAAMTSIETISPEDDPYNLELDPKPDPYDPDPELPDDDDEEEWDKIG